MKLDARTEIVINGESVTHRQLQALEAISRAGSMSAAAKEMGVTVPVVHRYIANIENAAGEPVTRSTPSGTALTPAGKEVCRRFRECEARCHDNPGYTLCCSPVTYDLVTAIFSSLKLTDVDLVVSDDVHNIRSMTEGLCDIAIIDDPLYLFDIDDYGFEADEIGNMGMVYVDNGPSFIRYKYGAQRVAFMFLDSAQRSYSIDAETYSLTEMLGSNKSFFVDEFLLLRKGLRLKSAVDPKILKHAITAIYRSDDRLTTKIIAALKQRLKE